MITIQLSEKSRQLLEALGSADQRVLEAIARAHDAVNERTVGHISLRRMSANKFEPPRPPSEGIMRTSGRAPGLRSSLWNARATVNGTTVRSSIGSPIHYAGIHEFGWRGTRRAHQRRTDRGMINVKASKVFSIPARMPIQRGIADCIPDYEQTISSAIEKAIVTPT